MTNYIKINGVTFNLVTVNALTSGHGHKKISVTLAYENQEKEFSAITNDMPSYDEAQDVEDYKERRIELFAIIENSIEDEIMEWYDELTAYYYIYFSKNGTYSEIDTDGNLSAKMDASSRMKFETEEEAEKYLAKQENTENLYTTRSI